MRIGLYLHESKWIEMNLITNNEAVYKDVTSFIRKKTFSCVAAKTADIQLTIRHRHYAEMAEITSTEKLHSDLVVYCGSRKKISKTNATFIATFSSPYIISEYDFEHLLWEQLSILNNIDSNLGYQWHADIASSPESPYFSYCVAGEPFFIVGLHPQASRRSRKAPMAMLAFNSHFQFSHLKKIGIFSRLQKIIRENEVALDGFVNPNIADYGNSSEARQYSGKATDFKWKCPFFPVNINQENDGQ